VYDVDLHTHTRFFHGFTGKTTPYDPVGVRLLAAVAGWRGLDGIATTNHDYGRDFSIAGGTVTIPGIEVTTTGGHMLIVGPDPPRMTEPSRLTPHQAVEVAHDRNCAAIVAHPYRNSTIRETDADFDAVEVNGKGIDHERVADLAGRLNLPLVGGSDAHYPVEVGRAFTRVDADELTPESVVEAIRDGRVAAYISESRTDQVLRSIYTVIHTRKGWLDRPTAPGVGPPPEEDAGEGLSDVEAAGGEPLDAHEAAEGAPDVDEAGSPATGRSDPPGSG